MSNEEFYLFMQSVHTLLKNGNTKEVIQHIETYLEKVETIHKEYKKSIAAELI